MKTELRKLLGERKIVIGRENCIKVLKKGKLEKVLVASNSSKETLDTIQKYGRIAKVDVELLQLSNKDVGTLCKKPFPVSVIGVCKS